ncbi:hypothetical protein SAL_1882 [Streptococcus agalactiae 515]|nr:hypothetical protein SAL_1882 [Streptococcus agalactiae 515]
MVIISMSAFKKRNFFRKKEINTSNWLYSELSEGPQTLEIN